MTIPWFRPLIEREAAKVNIDPDLVEAIVWQESSGRCAAYRYEPMFWSRYLQHDLRFNTYDPQRVSASYGLMQVMYSTAWELGFRAIPELLFVPETALEYGVLNIASLILWAKGDTWKAVAAYNGGKGAWEQAAPQRYQASVRAWFDKIKARSGGANA